MSSTWKGNYPYAFGAMRAAAVRAAGDLDGNWKSPDRVARQLREQIAAITAELDGTELEFDASGKVKV